MRLIGLLVALLAVGWLVMTQLNSTATSPVTVQGENGTISAPRNAEELQTFEDQINSLTSQRSASQQETLDSIE